MYHQVTDTIYRSNLSFLIFFSPIQFSFAVISTRIFSKKVNNYSNRVCAVCKCEDVDLQSLHMYDGYHLLNPFTYPKFSIRNFVFQSVQAAAGAVAVLQGHRGLSTNQTGLTVSLNPTKQPGLPTLSPDKVTMPETCHGHTGCVLMKYSTKMPF